MLLAACGGGGGGSDSGAPTGGGTVDLAVGGTLNLSSGAAVKVLAGTGQGNVVLTGVTSGAAGAVDGGGVVVSAAYTLDAQGLESGMAKVPLLVTLPVVTDSLPKPIDAYAFCAETYDSTEGRWVGIDGHATFDATARTVTFQTGHLSQWRVKYRGVDPTTNMHQYDYYTDHFALHFVMPTVLGQTSKFAPLTNAEWAGKGSFLASNPEVPNYVNDLGRALELALASHLTLRGSAGQQLFSPPSPSEYLDVYVTYIEDGAGDSRLGGPIRIKSKLDDWAEMRATAGHELVHVLADQHYTMLGATMNRWFFEATANLWSTRASGLDPQAAATYYSKEMSTYLRSPLDASEEGSYYAAADFLDWAQQKTGRPLAADVMLADSTWDISALSQALTSGSKGFGDYFTDYVLEATMGSHDLKPLHLWTPPTMLTAAAHGWRYEFKQPHLSAQAVAIRTDLPVDGLLVATSGRGYLNPKLKTYSYPNPAIPLVAFDTNVERQTAQGKPVAVKHFGKAGTPGVTSSLFQQIVVNPEVSDDTVGAQYVFDYYLLEPPVENSPRAAAAVSWTFSGDGIPSPYSGPIVQGFNVYRDGLKLNANPLSPASRRFDDALILANSDVTVTVVDTYGNEWPEVLPKSLPTTCSVYVEMGQRTFLEWNIPYNVVNFGFPPSFMSSYGSGTVSVIAASGAYSGSSYSSLRNIVDQIDRETRTGTLTFQLNATGTEITQFSTSEKMVASHNGNFGGGYEVEIAGGGLPVRIEGGKLTAEVRGTAACSKLTKLVQRDYWEPLTGDDWWLHSELQSYTCDANSVVRVTCE